MPKREQFIPAKDWREFIITFRNMEADTASFFTWFENIKEYLEIILGEEYCRDYLAYSASVLQHIRHLRSILNDDIYYLDLQPDTKPNNVP